MLKKLSLTKQLLVVFCGLLLIFVSIAIPIINYNLHVVIDKEMFDEIESDQAMIDNYGSFIPRRRARNQFYHIRYYAETDTYDYDMIIGRDQMIALGLVSQAAQKDLQTILKDDNHKAIQGKIEYDETVYYYRIMQMENEDQTYLISFMSSNYSKSLINSIRNRIIYFQFAFLGFVAIVIMIWVLSLIHPLKRIKVYVEGITQGKDMTLNLDRKDEIGVVGRAIVDMNAELAKQAHIKEEMIHNISHDLKTPIALIKTYGQSVKDDIYPYGDKNASMDVILENAERLEHKVQDLLYLNRLDYLGGEKKPETPFAMKELIEHIVLQMDALSTIHLETELADVTFIGSEEHWRVAIENIIDNACRYARSLIRIELKEDYLAIYNDGEAIDAALINDLFSPYVKGVNGQFGLGLAIVHKIATMYGYKVYARNETVGVSFIFEKN